MGAGAPKLNHLSDDVAGFEGSVHLRQLLVESGTQFFPQRFSAKWSARRESDFQHSFLWTTSKQVDRVDGVAGRLDPDESGGNAHMLLARNAADDVQRLERGEFRAFDARAGRSPEP